MILTCPQCETRYQADASKFAAPGRKVRCAKCGHVWLQEPPAPEDADAALETLAPPEPAAATEVRESVAEAEPQRAAFVPVAERTVEHVPPAPVERRKTAPSRAPRRIGMIAGWVGLVIVILVIGWSALTYSQQIATVWPQASSLYAALGMHVNTRGLDFVDVAYHNETEDGLPVLAVSGKLVNVSAREVLVPPIEITLTDNNKRMINHWSFSAVAHTLRPGQQVAFLWRLSSPPNGARHLELRFAETGG